MLSCGVAERRGKWWCGCVPRSLCGLLLEGDGGCVCCCCCCWCCCCSSWSCCCSCWCCRFIAAASVSFSSRAASTSLVSCASSSLYSRCFSAERLHSDLDSCEREGFLIKLSEKKGEPCWKLCVFGGPDYPIFGNFCWISVAV